MNINEILNKAFIDGDFTFEEGEGEGHDKVAEASCGGKSKKKKMKDQVRALTKDAGMPFLEQDRPEKVKDIYRALERDHPEYSAEKKARIASSRGQSKTAAGNESSGTPWGTNKYGDEFDAHHRGGHKTRGAPIGGSLRGDYQKRRRDYINARTGGMSERDALERHGYKKIASSRGVVKTAAKNRPPSLLRETAKGALIGSALGGIPGAAAGVRAGRIDEAAREDRAGYTAAGALMGALPGAVIGGGAGLLRGLDKRHEYDKGRGMKKKAEEGVIDAPHPAVSASPGVDTPAFHAGFTAAVEARAKGDPELERHLEDANARNWSVGRALTSKSMSRTSGEH